MRLSGQFEPLYFFFTRFHKHKKHKKHKKRKKHKKHKKCFLFMFLFAFMHFVLFLCVKSSCKKINKEV